jgi:hypothetical protein
VFLPFVSASLRILPLALWSQGGALAYLPPLLLTAVATLECLLFLLWTLGRRDPFAVRQASSPLLIQAIKSSVIGGVALIAYMVAYHEIKHDFYYRVLGWDSEERWRGAGDLLLLILYTSVFVSVTRSLSFLGLYRQVARRE